MAVAKNRRRQIEIWAKRNFVSKYEVSRAKGWGATAVWKSRLKRGIFKILLWATGGLCRAVQGLKRSATKFRSIYVLTRNLLRPLFGLQGAKRVWRSQCSSATWWWNFSTPKKNFKNFWAGDSFEVCSIAVASNLRLLEAFEAFFSENAILEWP